MHEAIITEDEYQQVRKALKRRKQGIPPEKVFFAKVRCAVCDHVMKRSEDKLGPSFKCKTGRFTNHYNCTEQPVPQAEIERVVLKSLKVFIDTLIKREELRLEAIQKSKDTKISMERKIKAERQSVTALEHSITKIFTSLASGDMTKEAFISKKEVINAAVAKKKKYIETLEAGLADLTSGKGEIEDKLAELYSYYDLETLDRNLVDLLIDRILVHGGKKIEIVWYDRR